MSTTHTEHIVLCTGCGLPFDEMPNSHGEWLIMASVVDCTAGDPLCPGHTLKKEIYCMDCQRKGIGRHGTQRIS